MYFLVNASRSKPLPIATSNFAVHRSHDVVYWATYCVTLDPKVNGKKSVICDGVPLTAV